MVMLKSFSLVLILCFTLGSVHSQAGSGNCLKFDGTNYVDCGNPPENLFDFTGDGTIEAWVKILAIPPVADGATCYSILAKDERAGEFNKWIFGVQNGKLAFHINSPDANHNWVYSNPFTLVLNKYYHFAMTKNAADEVTFYINGSFMGTFTLPHKTTVVNSNLMIGNSEPNLEMNGEIDEVRFWKRILTQNELRNWMCRKINRSHPAYSDLVANYLMNEGFGMVTSNYNGVKSTLVNNPEWVRSAAPIGDSAVADFLNNIKLASLINLRGERFTASITQGMPDGIIVYRVDEIPNTVAGINTAWYNTSYFGVFIAEVNSSSPTYSGQYYYTGNQFLTPENECAFKLYTRVNNADTLWMLTGSSPNLTNHSFSISGAGAEYILAGDSINKPSDIVISSDDSDNIVCSRATVTFTATSTNAGLSPTYQWKLNGSNTGVNSSTYSGNSFINSDIVQCVLTNNMVCATPVTSNSIVIHVPFDVKLGRDTGFCLTDGLTLQVSDTFAVYHWSTGVMSSSIKINQSGSYWLQTLDQYSCISADTINVTTKNCGFAIPTAFSPNNDGRNDVFKPLLSGAIIAYSFTIYNRWGEKIFNTNKPSAGWNGFNKNQMQLPGTYVWVCEYQLAGQPLVVKKGAVLLMK
jgi:gliding motility-associated-like protein